MKTCLNRFVGRCKKKCERDYNSNHRPNNYDCSDYYEINMRTFEITNQEEKEGDNKNALDRKTQTKEF